jgi:ketosteroid isomerase-like protein
MKSPQNEMAALLDRRSAAIRQKDLDRLMSFYSDDVIYFDLVPPLVYVGSSALRGRFSHWFASYTGPIGQEIDDLHVHASGDVAVASMLIRAGGTLTTGPTVGFWVRATSSCQRTGDDRWLIAHEHVSLPVDLTSGKAAMHLRP